jgi:Zn-dependent membrane protease YugP
MLALLACILFVLAAFGVNFEAVGIVELGLALLAAHLVVGHLITLPAFRRAE